MMRVNLFCAACVLLFFGLATAWGAGEGDGLKSLEPKVFLFDGREFKTWRPALTFSRTLYVNGSAANASDDNPGTKGRPFKTINRAARVAVAGQRVLVASGVYREWVRPRRGGESPAKMISYQAAPGAKVVIKGSRVVTDKWQARGAKGVWKLALQARWFKHDYNPFALPNVTPKQFDMMSWAQRWRGKKPYTLPRGLVFQDARRLVQVNTLDDLAKRPGTYQVDVKGQILHVHPFDNKDPNTAVMEITTQRCVFAPERTGLGYIHDAGFIIEHAGNPFPFPQYGALSTWRGHHWLIERNTVRAVNSVGIDIGDQYWALDQPKVRAGWHIVRNNTITDCGVCGIQGLACRDGLIENNLLVGNAIYNVEGYYETAAIKTHGNANTLIRGNRIFDTLHGGGIWMDFANVNSRCSRNIIVNSSTMHGGIFIEASLKPNMIDRNFIWLVRGAGIYEHDSRAQIICHNFIGKSTGPAIRLRGKVTNRKVGGEKIVSGNHTVTNNILFNSRIPIETRDKHADLSNNVSEGIAAEFDRKTMTLTWSAGGKRPSCRAVKNITRDFFAKPLDPQAIAPGPFGAIPQSQTALKLYSAPAGSVDQKKGDAR